MYRWEVCYETAVIKRGQAETELRATQMARIAHDMLVCQGFNPDKLSYGVTCKPQTIPSPVISSRPGAKATSNESRVTGP